LNKKIAASRPREFFLSSARIKRGLREGEREREKNRKI
jgi:hypothetical protein